MLIHSYGSLQQRHSHMQLGWGWIKQVRWEGAWIILTEGSLTDWSSNSGWVWDALADVSYDKRVGYTATFSVTPQTIWNMQESQRRLPEMTWIDLVCSQCRILPQALQCPQNPPGRQRGQHPKWLWNGLGSLQWCNPSHPKFLGKILWSTRRQTRNQRKAGLP